ncbi:vesicular inhibitory amino acid transporter [Aplochiton taeniatus]
MWPPRWAWLGSRLGWRGEDRLGLTQSDELNRTYAEENDSTAISNREEGLILTQTQPAECSPGTGIGGTLTTWEAGWNVTNAIQGIFVLGLPYALLHSGVVGLVLLVLAAVVCNYTGQVLVSCLYEDDGTGSKVRVRQSYQEVANAVLGPWCPRCPHIGGWLVNVAQMVELLMTCSLYLLVATSLLQKALSWRAIPRSVCSLVTLLCLLPCLLLADLKSVSTLSLLCSLAHALSSVLVMLCCLSRAGSWSWLVLSRPLDPEELLVSVGVIIFSYTSQIFLLPLEGSMRSRQDFPCMLGWTHAAACIMKTSFSLLAVLTWGVETKEVITENLPPDLGPLVNLCLLAKALLSYPLPFYAAAEILLSQADSGAAMEVALWTLLGRGLLLMTSFLMALVVPGFSWLMGLTGSVTGAAMTLILPCLFHLLLHWHSLTRGGRLLDLSILTLGALCSLAGLVCSLKGLLTSL